MPHPLKLYCIVCSDPWPCAPSGVKGVHTLGAKGAQLEGERGHIACEFERLPPDMQAAIETSEAVADPFGLRAHVERRRAAVGSSDPKLCRAGCGKVKVPNLDGDCSAACTRSRERAQAHRERIAALAGEDPRMAIALGQACRAHGEQLAKDAEVFDKTPGHEGLALDFRQRSAWLMEMAEELECQ